jgi:hypothetical protein
MPAGERISSVSEESGPGQRWRAAFAALGERAAPGPACPEPDRLWAAATAESPPAERHEIIAHTASCPSCAAAFRLARGLSQGEIQRADHGETGRAAQVVPLSRPVRRPWLRWAAPLAALAAAVALAILVPGGWRSVPGPFRGGEPGEIRSQLSEGATLPREQADLRWSAGPPGSLYEVRVSTREGREIAVESGLETPQYRIPPSALTGAPAGTLLYWQVRALQPDGKSTVSKTFSVRLE